MQRQILTFINSQGLFSFDHRLAVAVSGGKDSMALLHAMYHLGFKVFACHCNFGLRGEFSDKDEIFVKDFCEKLKIPFFSSQFKTKDYAQKNKISTQMAARALRYAWFEKIRLEQNADFIVTAHHLGDNLETLLLNFTNGTGPTGLKGIPVKAGHIVRPMLEIQPKQIENYLFKNDISWREDASNQTNDYARNKIRNQVLPVLSEINPGIFHTARINLNRFNDLNSIFKSTLSDFISTSITVNSDCIEIDYKKWQTKPGFELILEEFLKPYGFNYLQVNSLLKILHSGKFIESESHKIVKSANAYFLYEKNRNNLNITLDDIGYFVFLDFALNIEISNNFPAESEMKDKNLAFLDLTKIKWPIRIRNWEIGDRFRPFGMKGTKLISDFLTDLKLNPIQKRNQLVLESDNELVWVVGQRIAENFRISSNSSQILKIKFEKKNPIIVDFK